MSKPEEYKVDMPLYVTVERTPYMRADVSHDLLEALKICYKVFKMDEVDTAISLSVGMAIAKAEGGAV